MGEFTQGQQKYTFCGDGYSDKVPVCMRADLDSMIFAYNCYMRLAHVLSATRIVLFKSDVQHHHDSCTQHKKCRRLLNIF